MNKYYSTKTIDRNKVLAAIKDIVQKLNKNANTPLAAPMPFLLYRDRELVMPGTITTIQGKAGSHKSHLAQDMVKTLLQGPGQPNLLEMVKPTEAPILVLYIDSERDIYYELPQAIRGIAEALGKKIPDPYFQYLSVSSFLRHERLAVIEILLEEVRKEYDGEICVIIDVATDLINDFNSVTDTLMIQDALKGWLVDFRCAIVALIHENPGGNKMRGHMGTELLNKASNSLQTTLDEEYVVITHLKCRNGQPVAPLTAIYNSATRRLEAITSLPLASKGHTAFEERLVELFKTKPRLSRQEILEGMKDVGRSADSIDNYLKSQSDLTIDGHKYLLSSIREGKETIYILEPAIASESR